MAAGLPIVADDVGQVGEYVQRQVSGYLVPPDEVRAFTTGIVRLLGDEQLREELGRQARRSVVRQFGWPRLAPKVERAYVE